MKIGILTFHRALNYGAVLQAYALRKTIEQLGKSVEIIDYGKIGEEPRINLNYSGIKPFIASILLLMLSLFNADKRRKRFKMFRNTYLGISARRYINASELEKANEEYDTFITGSDQVWNPFLSKNDSTYLLSFTKDQKRRISYAASFGRSSIPDNLKEDFVVCLAKFDFTSVREKSGRAIVYDLIKKNAEVVLDPVFLLTPSEWTNIANPPTIKDKYILCFVIMQDPPGFINFCRHIAKLTGYKLVRIANPKYRIETGIKVIASAGPNEFLGLFKNASIVITNSFHGTAFSIIYQKPFFTWLYNNDRDIRLQEITGRLGLIERLVSEKSKYPVNLQELEIDYTPIFKSLNSEREKSLSFLKSSLKD